MAEHIVRHFHFSLCNYTIRYCGNITMGHTLAVIRSVKWPVYDVDVLVSRLLYMLELFISILKPYLLAVQQTGKGTRNEREVDGDQG